MLRSARLVTGLVCIVAGMAALHAGRMRPRPYASAVALLGCGAELSGALRVLPRGHWAHGAAALAAVVYVAAAAVRVWHDVRDAPRPTSPPSVP